MPMWLDDMTGAGEPVIPENLKNTVWEREEGQCQKCGATDDLQVYCVVPYAMPKESNSKLLCKACRKEF